MAQSYQRNEDERVRWLEVIPFGLVHLMPLAAIWTGVTLNALILCVTLYIVRMFFITAGFHRYFAHRSYQMNRFWQFIFAFGATSAAQKGPLWWAGYHRHHHRFSDMPEDIHSPLKGLWWSHLGWILAKKYKQPRLDYIQDFAKFSELRWLDKYHLVPPILLGAACLLIAGLPGLFIGFFLSTVLLYHGTFVINSLAHLIGRRRYVTNDTSRNSFLLSLITLGEGWHNNHHYFQSSTRQGFFWWEIDVSYTVLTILNKLGVVHNLRQPPQELLDKNRVVDGIVDVGIFKSRLLRAKGALERTKKKTGRVYESRKRRLEFLLENARQAAEEVTRQSVIQC